MSSEHEGYKSGIEAEVYAREFDRLLQAGPKPQLHFLAGVELFAQLTDTTMEKNVVASIKVEVPASHLVGEELVVRFKL